MNFKTEIQETMQLYAKADQNIEQIKEHLQENLTSQKHGKPTLNIYPRVDKDGWTVKIEIFYSSLCVNDIETVYSIVSQIKQLFQGNTYTLDGIPQGQMYVFQIIMEDEHD